MKIAFSFIRTGLANNGGTRTILRCAETLACLGHEVVIWGKRGNYSWHNPVGVSFRYPELPQCDAVVATGVHSVKSVVSPKTRVPVKAYYIRCPEFWIARESSLLKTYRAVPRLLVNSEWQQDYLKAHGLESKLQYPGLDLDWFQDADGERAGVGALMHRHSRKRGADCVELESVLGRPIQLLNVHISNADSHGLNRWYNRLKVWFAPSELEGLHNPPMEAALAGCALVCTDHARSGMRDYAFHGETALVYPARNIKQAAACVRELLNDEDLRRRLNRNLVDLLKTKMGSRMDRMREFSANLGA